MSIPMRYLKGLTVAASTGLIGYVHYRQMRHDAPTDKKDMVMYVEHQHESDESTPYALQNQLDNPTPESEDSVQDVEPTIEDAEASDPQPAAEEDIENESPLLQQPSNVRLSNVNQGGKAAQAIKINQTMSGDDSYDEFFPLSD